MFVFTFTTTLFNVSVKENICLYFDDKQSNIYNINQNEGISNSFQYLWLNLESKWGSE